VTDPPQDRLPPPGVLAAGAPAAVLAALPGARAVGGCVRDLLAGREVHDVDVAAPLPPEAIALRLRDAGLKVFETGLAHGTVTAVLDRATVEVTALRRDIATDGRHAEVAWTTDWREDAARRDFTINAMSCDAAGMLWDYFGGRADLAAGRVRFVGDPATRLAEDYLRALRFFRFWARYGRGDPDAAALAAIGEAVPGLQRRIAPERIWMELKRLMEAADPIPGLALMAATGVLGAVLPEGVPPALDDLRRALEAGIPADPVLRLAVALPPAMAGQGGGDGAAIARRLRVSGEERDRIVRLHDTGIALPDLRDPASRARWYATRPGAAAALDEAWLAQARGAGDLGWLRGWIAATPHPELPVQGRDAVALGLRPGPEIGRVLAGLREWWLEGGCAATREDAMAELRRRIAGAANGNAAPATPPDQA
jgi:poly(A) polymerase/tRNA nucleotidyltransferase (CCA-adding enzyme)